MFSCDRILVISASVRSRTTTTMALMNALDAASAGNGILDSSVSVFSIIAKKYSSPLVVCSWRSESNQSANQHGIGQRYCWFNSALANLHQRHLVEVWWRANSQNYHRKPALTTKRQTSQRTS